MSILSIDLETSGLCPHEHEILSIGAVTENYKWFYREVKWDKLIVSPSAMKVNQIDLRENKGIPLNHALFEFNKWLKKHFTEDENAQPSILPLGFNVGSFDMKFLKRAYEKYSIQYPFHYRHIELNSILYYLDIEKIKYSDDIWKKIPEIFRRYNIQEKPELHNALADAVFAMACWHDLKLSTIERRKK